MIWYRKYHIVWVPKYCLRILKGELEKEVRGCIPILGDMKLRAVLKATRKESQPKATKVLICLRVGAKPRLPSSGAAANALPLGGTIKNRPFAGLFAYLLAGLEFHVFNGAIKYMNELKHSSNDVWIKVKNAR